LNLGRGTEVVPWCYLWVKDWLKTCAFHDVWGV
jgi:hypothetical protein